MNVAYNADCLAAMREMPDNAFDLAVVDPPYGIDAGKMTMGSGEHRFEKGKNWDASIPCEEYFTQLFRVSENQIIWGGNYFTQFLKPSPNWIVWDKKNPNLSFAEGELAWVNKGNNLRIFSYNTVKAANEDPKVHPTQKPVALYRWIFQHYAKQGDKILDTHLGSGSSRIAAYDAGLDFVGYEIDETYFRLQEERFARHTAQMNLFLEGDNT